jgi:hypothetical protein
MTLLQALTTKGDLGKLEEQILHIESTIEQTLQNVPEDYANLIGALISHQNGLLLH